MAQWAKTCCTTQDNCQGSIVDIEKPDSKLPEGYKIEFGKNLRKHSNDCLAMKVDINKILGDVKDPAKLTEEDKEICKPVALQAKLLIDNVKLTLRTARSLLNSWNQRAEDAAGTENVLNDV